MNPSSPDFDRPAIQAALRVASDRPVIGRLFRVRSATAEFTEADATDGQVVLSTVDGVWRTEIVGFRDGVVPRIDVSGDRVSVSLVGAGTDVNVGTTERDLQSLGVYGLLDPRAVASRSRSNHVSEDGPRVILDCSVHLAQFGLPDDYLRWLGVSEHLRSVRIVFEAGRLIEVRQADLPPQRLDTIVAAFS